MSTHGQRARVAVLVLAVVAAFAACDGADRGGEDGAGHEHEADAARTDTFTVWGERHELFVEHPYLVQGRPARFVTHVTDLRGFRPRARGEIVLVLAPGAGGSPVEVRVPEPARDGLYAPEIAFPAAGEWDVSVRIPEADRTYEVRLPTRWVFADEAEAARVVGAPAPEGIQFLKEQQWTIPFGTEAVRRRKVVERLRVPGVVAAPPGRRAVVHAPVAGRLEVPDDGRLPGLGERVEAGQVLGVVRPPITGSELLSMAANEQARTSLRQQLQAMVFERRRLEAELRVKLAETEAGALPRRVAVEHARERLETTRTLHARSARTDVQLEEARRELETARVELESVEALKTAYAESIERLASLLAVEDTTEAADAIEFPVFEVRAPIAGTVVAVDAVVGQHVQPDRPIFTILDAGRVFLTARVPETGLARIGAAPAALLAVPGLDAPPRPVSTEAGGRFVHLGLEVDPASRTVALVYEVPGDETLRIGMSVDLYVETDRAEEALVVPRSAIVDDSGVPVVFVQVSGETFARRPVELGIEDGGHVQVVSGVADGERVVTRGAYAVRLASVSTSIPAHGHAH